MASTIADQLARWARESQSDIACEASSISDPPHESVTRRRGEIPFGKPSWPREGARFLVPRNLVEAEMRLRECEESIAQIDRQIQERSPDQEDYESWKRKAETARRGYEYEISRMTTCIRVFREEAASDKAAFVLLEREREEARDSSRKLAAEVERLNGLLSELRADNRMAPVYAAFVEVAQMVLSEVTFHRIMERAKDKARRSGQET